MKIVITGASSGIGAGLARAYAAPGVFLCLIGRDQTRLGAVAQACAAKGAEVECVLLDVTDKQALSAYLTAAAPIDLLIANAGISAGTGADGETPAQAERIFATNIEGLVNTLHPVIPLMQARGQGQIVILASLAGFRGMPTAPAYSASKGFAKLYGEGLRGALAGSGVSVSVVCPGFVRTPMTDVNNFPMPFLMEVDAAAALIKRGIEQKKARIAFPFPLYFGMGLLTLLPPALTDWILAKLPSKPSVAKGADFG